MSVRPESDDAPSARRLITRERLLDAAVEVFAEDGLQGAAVESICSRAGFTRGAFYSNFETKEELFLALLEREFARRAEHLQEQVGTLEPELRQRSRALSPAEVASYVADFFAPENDAAIWFVLEIEFLLLAMRDSSLAQRYHEFVDGFYAGIAGAVEQAVEAAGRRFTLPAEQAVTVLASVYERSIRGAALSDGDLNRVAEKMSGRMATLLFALTEQVGEAT